MDSQIRLRIAGIRERKSGFIPLVAVGDAFDIVVDRGPSCIVLVWLANKKLAGNKSPYSLLSAEYKIFSGFLHAPF